MKFKLPILILFLSISLIGICQDRITTSGVFETGYENKRTIIYLPDSLSNYGIFPIYDLKPFYGLLSLKADWKGFGVYTSNKTYFKKDRFIYFDALLSEFKIGFSYTYKNIKGGYEHSCSHNISTKYFSESYDRIYLRIKLF